MKRKRGVQVCFICIQSAQRRDFSFFRFVKIFYSFKKQLWSYGLRSELFCGGLIFINYCCPLKLAKPAVTKSLRITHAL